jgi:signal transduction histidine kinase
MMLEGSFGTVPPPLREPLERISESSALMASSVEDYLSVSRIESGNMKYNCSAFNLANETEKIVDDLRRTAIKKGLVLTSKNDLTTPTLVSADLGKTQQIIHNLLTNAIKYTPRGSITVHIHESKKEKCVAVDVIDTGIGMSEETIAELFGKFVRAKNAHHVNASGTGLGLYIAREMARKMGGDIVATSHGEGNGSRFRLTLPSAS